MKYALNIDKETDRILSVCYVNQFTATDMVRVDALPEGNINDYRYVNGKYVFDPIFGDRNENEAVQAEINQLKSNLAATDYIAIKYAEGWITAVDYLPTKQQRQTWRDRINELELSLK